MLFNLLRFVYLIIFNIGLKLELCKQEYETSFPNWFQEGGLR